MNISDIHTFAILKDGKWYEKGNMGWWGVVSDENEQWDKEFERIISEVNDNELITIVDCHI